MSLAVPSTQYIYCPSIKLVMAYCRKAASSSLHRTLFDLKEPAPSGRAKLEKPEARRLITDQGFTCALFVRHPYDRLVSAYEFFCYRYPVVNAKRGRPDVMFWYRQHGLPQGPGNFTFEQFVNVALGQWPHDKHVAPQYPEHRDESGLLPSLIWPLEHAQEGWDILRAEVPGLPEELQHRNSTERDKGWQEYMDELSGPARAKIRRFYADDLLFHENARVIREHTPWPTVS